jgi:hypothetical protein
MYLNSGIYYYQYYLKEMSIIPRILNNYEREREREREREYTSLGRWAWERELSWQLSIFASNWITVCRWGTLQKIITQISHESQKWNVVDSNTREVIKRYSFFSSSFIAVK